MSVFDTLKFYYLSDVNDKNLRTKNFVCGGVAGAAATALTYPTDLLRRKMQLIVSLIQGYSNQPLPYTNISECIQHIYKNEGIPGFFRGLVPCFAKVIPAIAVAFAVNEELKKTLNLSKS